MGLTEKIEKAIEMMDIHDWYWYMSEDSRYEQSAKAEMRAFVSMAMSCGKEINQALRELWTLTSRKKAYMSKMTEETYNVQRSAIINRINAIAA